MPSFGSTMTTILLDVWLPWLAPLNIVVPAFPNKQQSPFENSPLVFENQVTVTANHSCLTTTWTSTTVCPKL
jgi:hypothetical protein